MPPGIQAANEPMQPGFDYFENRPVKAGVPNGVPNDNMYHQRTGSLPKGSRNNEFGNPMNGGGMSAGNYHQNGSMANTSMNGMPNINSSVNDLD